MWWTWSRGIEGQFAPFTLLEACQRTTLYVNVHIERFM